jgi:hypothetical protein
MLLLSFFASSTISDAARGATKALPARGTLKIEITGLEKGALANVEVTGPKFHRSINRPVTLKGLMPGKYSLTPERVAQSNGIETPAPPTAVKVKRGVTTDASANYYFVPNTTITISPEQTVSIVGPMTGAQTLVLSGSNATVVPGEILASGPTSSRPDGYLLSVTSATVTGDEITVEAEPATLAQAIPDGSLNLEQVLEEVNSAFSSGTADSSNSSSPHLRTARGFPSDGLSCSGTGSVSVVPSLGFTFTGASASVGISWKTASLSASVSMSYSIKASLAVSASAAATCSAHIPLLQGTGPSILVDPGVPIVLTPIYSVDLDGSAEVGGSFSQNLSETVGVSMAAQDPGGFTSSATPESSTTSVGENVNAAVDLQLLASIGIEVDGLAGVSLDAGPELNLTADPTTNPTWSLQGCIDGGFTANILGNTVIDQSTALSWCTVLAHAVPKHTYQIVVVLPANFHAVVGVPFDYQLKATGGKGPYAFSVERSPGVLAQIPPGLKFSTNGLLSGTPTKKGFYQFDVFVSGTEGSNPLDQWGVAIVVNLPGCTNPYSSCK